MDTENQELDINTTEGLQTFWKFVTDVYSDLQAVIVTAEDTKRIRGLYEELRELIEKNLDRKEKGYDVSLEDSELIQTKYDDLVDILEACEEAVRAVVKEVIATDEEQKAIAIESEGVLSLDGGRNERGSEVVSTVDQPVKQSVPTSQKDKGWFIKEAARISARAETLLERYEEITTTSPVQDEFAVARHYYSQLSISAKRAKEIEEHIKTELPGGSSLRESVAEHYEDILMEIDENLDQLSAGLELYFEIEETDSVEEVPSIASAAVTRGAVVIDTDVIPEKSIPIQVTAPTPKELQSIEPIHNSLPVSTSPSESSAPERIIGRTLPELTKYVDKVLTIPRYRDYVESAFSSRAQLEAKVRREIARMEDLSKFEKVFGFTYASPFYTFFKDMTPQEISEFDSQPRQQIRQILKQKEIKYEQYLDWVDVLIPMLETTHVHPDITFAELFIRTELELLIREKQSRGA